MRVIARTATLLFAATLAACGDPAPIEKPPAGDVDRGRVLLRQYGCGTCHRIPGVAVADGDVGPPLVQTARQVYLAGTLPNSPANMALFIRAPQSIKPQTAMPDLKVGEAHARDMVAYLYALP